jgi:hypothetical protein
VQLNVIARALILIDSQLPQLGNSNDCMPSFHSAPSKSKESNIERGCRGVAQYNFPLAFNYL